MTTLADIYKSDYRVRYKNCLRQLWKYEKVWSCIGNPKESCILLYLDGCSAEYTLKDGTAFTAKSGSVVFCPKGSEYSVEFFDFSDNNSGTVGVNFDIETEKRGGLWTVRLSRRRWNMCRRFLKTISAVTIIFIR